MKFTVAFLPGRFDAPSGGLCEWLEANRPDIAGHTEVVNSARREISRAKRLLTHGKGGPNGSGNTANSWPALEARFTGNGERVAKVTDWTYFRKGGGEVEAWAPFTVLEDATNGRSVVVSTLHAPAHVEGPNGFRRYHRTRAHRAAVRGWKRYARKYQAIHNADARILMIDGNVNYQRDIFARWFRRTFPRLAPADRARGQSRFSPRATHGRRAIDRILVSRALRVIDYRIVNSPEGYDHNWLLATVEWRKRSRSA